MKNFRQMHGRLSLRKRGRTQSNIKSDQLAPKVLSYFAVQENLPVPVYEAILTNPKTPHAAITSFARNSKNGELLELISLNQQLLIRLRRSLTRSSQIRFARRKPNAVRRKSNGIFRKGTRRGADRQRTPGPGKKAAAEFIEQAEFSKDLQDFATETNLSYEDASCLPNISKLRTRKLTIRGSRSNISKIYTRKPMSSGRKSLIKFSANSDSKTIGNFR